LQKGLIGGWIIVELNVTVVESLDILLEIVSMEINNVIAVMRRGMLLENVRKGIENLIWSAIVVMKLVILLKNAKVIF
jgi:hypothetical protein